MAKDIFQITFKQKTFDILSADTGFYAYMDDSRLYYTFEKLVCDADLPMFLEYTKKLYAESFILRLNALDGSVIPFYAAMRPGTISGQMHLTLIDIAKWISDEKASNTKYAIQSKLLELYGDAFFIYDPQTRDVCIYSKFDFTSEDSTLSLDEFEKLLTEHCDNAKDVTQFILSLQNSARTLELRVNGDLLGTSSDAKYTYIKGTSIYENGVRSYSVGYIHRTLEASQASIRKAELDPLTGVLNKSAITNRAIRCVDIEKRQNVSIAIVDVDYFKKVNDTYGHMIGDDLLKKVTSIMEAEIGNSGVIGRIGGDEFFILFYDAYNLEDSRERLRSIKNIVRSTFPDNKRNQPVITLSIGCAAYPKDADNYKDLFTLADYAVYLAKAKGRNRYIIYDEEKHGSLEQIKNTANLTTCINSRDDMSMGDVMCIIMDRVYNSESYPMDRLLNDYIENFEPERITIYNFERAKITHTAGIQICSPEIIEETQDYIHGEFWKKSYAEGDVVIDDVSIIERKDHIVYEQMRSQGIISCIHIKFWDKNGARCVLSLESVTKKITWNNDHMHYYRLMARLLSQYKIV
ncbi:MAG: GGDEF domain-containing protein [Lachnospiraceae bacterium]|nr:GGDEF domain-containing protein [Lachnospiraceae bacterium]